MSSCSAVQQLPRRPIWYLTASPLAEALTDHRFAALLIGPGLGRDAAAREALALVLAEPVPAVLDADALVLLAPRLLAERTAPLIATPHEGELAALEQAFGLEATGGKVARAAGPRQGERHGGGGQGRGHAWSPRPMAGSPARRAIELAFDRRNRRRTGRNHRQPPGHRGRSVCCGLSGGVASR